MGGGPKSSDRSLEKATGGHRQREVVCEVASAPSEVSLDAPAVSSPILILECICSLTLDGTAALYQGLLSVTTRDQCVNPSLFKQL